MNKMLNTYVIIYLLIEVLHEKYGHNNNTVLYK